MPSIRFIMSDLPELCPPTRMRRGLSEPSVEAILAVIVLSDKARKPINLCRLNNMLDLAETLQSQPNLH